MNVSDAELVAAWRKGATAAFEALFRRHFGSVWALALSITLDSDQAEDVCQQAFIRCWERREQCHEPTRFRGWLLAIARSVAYNQVNRARRRQTSDVKVDALQHPVAADSEAEAHDLRVVLLSSMREVLTDEQRTVLLLRDMEGWRHQEIAEHMDISETMSRRHLSDARKKMRAHLRQVGVHGK